MQGAISLCIAPILRIFNGTQNTRFAYAVGSAMCKLIANYSPGFQPEVIG